MLHKTLPMQVDKVHTDPQERYVGLVGNMARQQVNFISCYLPPQVLRPMLAGLRALLLSLPQGTTILGGDFNVGPDPIQNISTAPSVGRLLSWADSLCLCDAWHLQMRAFTHRLAAHHTEARIELIWFLAADLLTLTSVQILARCISDHAPVLLSWGTPAQSVRPMCCFSAWYLIDPECVEFINCELTNYF
ncbi:hypothetical protein NDU88_004786 [Pleurodeles waltl]|uniref:Endonuclease/exonuclease/phosphatase domain-containing protein n=1 Tax=Pleurodeles waltl TaxID=8319 RepID=A0AAV7TAD5_PLEWA|nr:hypothetical protein NDU88_004786 [Pleurodeles waltl]